MFEVNVDSFLLFGRELIPASFAVVAVVVLLEKCNVVFGEKTVKNIQHIIADIGACQVEYQLISLFRSKPVEEVENQSGCSR